MCRPLQPTSRPRMAVQFQSEWDGQNPDIRWGWVKRMWANPVQCEAQALKHKLAWVAAQKESATKALPALRERVAQAKGWQSKVSALKAEADSAVAAAVQAQTKARKTAAVHMRGSASMLASAKSWLAREEAKLQVGQDTLALVDPLRTELQKNLEASSRKPVDPNATFQVCSAARSGTCPPLAFIAFFANCHWLSKGELEAIYRVSQGLPRNLSSAPNHWV